jgi:hypothetical protein
MNASQITIAISDDDDISPTEGSTVTFYLDPSEGKVTYYMGDGQPMPAFNRRWMCIGWLRTNHPAKDVADWFRSRSETLANICNEYLGSRWDGSNRTGEWSDEAEDLAQGLCDDLDEARRDGELPEYFDANEYLGQSLSESVDAAVEFDTIKAYVEDTICDAATQGQLIDSDDLTEAITDALQSELEKVQERIDDLDEGDDGDEDDDERLAKLQALLAIVPGFWACDESGHDVYYPKAKTPEDAAQEYVDASDWGSPAKTIWIGVLVWKDGERDNGETHKISVDPEEPDCSEEEHHWSETSVRGKGGGVVLIHVCSHCECVRVTDTWAHDPSDGEQGLESVTYEEADEDDERLAKLQALLA